MAELINGGYVGTDDCCRTVDEAFAIMRTQHERKLQNDLQNAHRRPS
jgi:hypothetical protein